MTKRGKRRHILEHIETSTLITDQLLGQGGKSKAIIMTRAG